MHLLPLVIFLEESWLLFLMCVEEFSESGERLRGNEKTPEETGDVHVQMSGEGAIGRLNLPIKHLLLMREP
uniref:Glycosyl hydrolases family 38 C-terminal beta sandwich domain-containing protein n=1 Tax=Chromera velia CCMP2878 TaxID=1169474 RepID=A0A0G4F4V8_9ALVE|eukprot:Cvel_2717.t1-p1 / transcript=Cvel_2717.t1 / gene=Cvel_2717 / organism=Chromera_velia_CCMP2878 / gene_product=hypothetical protein / transcript_product=hypothetical protein / location=Cvel_scaffold109:29952-30161(-) / protein_length=70 / sequence_SO=supercontig / SO=protein_coding / is_pseudo=false